MYPSNAKVSLGDELTPTAVKDEPKVTWVTEQDSKYALIMSGKVAGSLTPTKLFLWRRQNEKDFTSVATKISK